MAGVESFSEYEGGGLMPNTVFPKKSDSLTPSDKLRLMSITGQTEDSRAPVDPYFWYGNEAPDPQEPVRLAQEARNRQRAIQAEQRSRYKETRS